MCMSVMPANMSLPPYTCLVFTEARRTAGTEVTDGCKL